MTSNFSKHQQKILSNLERSNNLYPHTPPELEIFKSMQNCPFDNGKSAQRFAGLYADKLNQEEFHKALYGNEIVPKLPSESSIEIGKTVHRKQPFLVSTKTVLHWLVYGASGFGKTTLLGVVERAVRGFFSCIQGI